MIIRSKRNAFENFDFSEALVNILNLERRITRV